MVIFRLRRRRIPRPVFVFPTDAHRVPGGARDKPPDPVEERRQKMRGGAMVLLLGAVFVAGAVGTIFGKGGLLDSRRLRHQRAQLEQQVEAQRNKVEALRQQVEELKTTPMARERIAREQLDYAKPGEVTFLLPGDESPGAEAGESETP